MSDSNDLSDPLTVAELQDFLILDDIFLDYFNEFLKLPVFPQPLEYQRLTDSFKIIDFGDESMVSCESPAPFIATEKEQARIMNWAQNYRLPLFLKTDLYRELKLCKLLLRPIDEKYNRHSTRRTFIHGYSKQSEYSSLATPNSSGGDSTNSSKHLTSESPLNDESKCTFENDNSRLSTYDVSDTKNYDDGGDDNDDDDDRDNYDLFDADEIPYDNFLRPGSEAISLPVKVELDRTSSDSLKNYRTNTDVSRTKRDMSNLSQDAQKGSRQKSFYKSVSDEEEMFFRIQSAPLNYDFVDYDFVYTNKVLYNKHRVLKFGHSDMGDEEEDDDERSEMDQEMEQIQNKHKISLNRLKELYIGNLQGMKQFRSFLKNTAGEHLVEFWLECEALRDSGVFSDPGKNSRVIVKFFRSIRDKFRQKLSSQAHQQLSNAMSNLTIDLQTVLPTFVQAQYDTLRRLRSYWLPRYLIHRDSIMNQVTLTQFFNGFLNMSIGRTDETVSIQSGIVPHFPLAHSLPILIKDTSVSWQQIFSNAEQSNFHEPWALKAAKNSNKQKSNITDSIFKRSLFQNRLRTALSIDIDAGSPFRSYLENLNMLVQINNLDFYQQVYKFRTETTRNSERLLRLSQAWEIVNRFLNQNSVQHIGVTEEMSYTVITNLKKMKHKLDTTVFNDAVEISVKKLDQEWLRFLKDDMKRFLESSNTQISPKSPPHSIEDIEVAIEGEMIVVRKRVIIPEYIERMKTWDKLSIEEKRKRRAEALEKQRITYIQRQKDLKAVRKRLKLEEEERKLRALSLMQMRRGNTKASTNPTQEETEKEEEEEINLIEEVESIEEVVVEVEESIPESAKILENKIFFELFKKYINDNMSKLDAETKNYVDLLIDIQAYMKVKSYDKRATITKATKATAIYKDYLDEKGKKHIDLPAKILTKIKNDNDRPQTPTLKDVRLNVLEKVSKLFTEFWKFQVNELGLKSEQLAKMSEKELETHAKAQIEDAKLDANKSQQTKADHTKEDKMRFMEALGEASSGPLSLRMLFFLKYLIDNPPSDLKNGLERDLYFYVEVLKLHEICKITVDEDIAKKKIQAINYVFLESASAPALQINIPNELAQRTISKVKRILTSKEVNISLFDEAQYHCLNNLLPYWAGFNKKQWQIPTDRDLIRPFSKHRQLLERRLQRYNEIPIPESDKVILPTIPKGTNITTLSYTMHDGPKWKSESLKDRFDHSDTDSLPPKPIGSQTTNQKRLSQGTSKLSVSVNM